MSVRQDIENGVGRLREIASKAFSLLKLSLKSAWQLTTQLALKVTKLLKQLFLNRSRIVGGLLLAAAISLLIAVLNHFIGFHETSNTANTWLLHSYRWLWVGLGIVFTLLLTWNNVSPTLRTYLNDSWSRATLWILIGAVLISYGLVKQARDNFEYRLVYVGGLILGLVVLSILSQAIPPKKISSTSSAYVPDDPEAHDDATLYETQTRIVSDIRYLIAGGVPSVFAITGRWGIGKTFLFKQAKKELQDARSIIWVNFEPWRYASEEALIRGFYQDIGKALSGKIPGVQRIARPLVETTDKFVRKQDRSGIVGAALDMLHDFTSSLKMPEIQIRDLLEQEHKRLVVVIDDVERSYDAERIFRTLQLSLFTKNIKNAQVIFLCDKEVVLSARPQHFNNLSQDATEYLEKFVEREVVVPNPRPSELRQMFRSLMESPPNHTSFEFDDDDLTDDMLSAIGTPRGVIRIYNEFAAFRLNQEMGSNL